MDDLDTPVCHAIVVARIHPRGEDRTDEKPGRALNIFLR